MSFATKLLAGAALCAALSVGIATTADAKTVRHKTAPKAAATAAEVSELRSEVQALKEQLATQAQAQQQAQQQTQAQVQQAQATAQTAQDQARMLQAKADDEIKTIPGQITSAVNAAKPKPGWEGSTSVSGRMYYDLTNIEQKKDGSKVAPSGTGFDIKRFYVGIDHKFNDTYSANITTDEAFVAADGLTQIYIKKAYLQAKISDALIVRLGSADLPWIPFAEDVYGYRFVENTIADRDKFGTSADWGAHALGKIGIFNYAVAVINGGGYKNPTRTKGMDIEGRVSTSMDGFTLGVGGYSGKLGKAAQGVTTFHTANRFDAIASYANTKFRVGVEYFAAENWNNVLTVAGDKSDGTSVFGNFNFTPQISAFGRYDWVKPSKTINSGLKDGYFNIGVNYEPVKIVDLALVYKRDQVDNGLLSTSNGTIGGVHRGAYDEVGLFGQLRW
jgi:type II secretory pathway pseudopilin PulG